MSRIAAIAASLAVIGFAAAPAGAVQLQEPPIPGTCDLIKNTICHLIPPDELSDLLEICERIAGQEACGGAPPASGATQRSAEGPTECVQAALRAIRYILQGTPQPQVCDPV